MMNFDSWEAAARPPEDYLMHFRTRGSKNGVRRYQNPDGSWTELGLEERRKREGWGESKKERKLQRKIERAERRQVRKAEKAQRQFERAEKKRKSKLSGLTDEEMKAKLERARMEREYKELTQKDHKILETGAKVVGKILDYKQNKELRILDLNKQKLELERLKTEQKKSIEMTKQAKEAANKAKYESYASRSEANKAKEERKQTEADVRGGLRLKRKAELDRAKKEYRETTLRGAIGKYFNSKAKGAGEAAGDYAKGQVESRNRLQKTKDIIRNEKKTAKYNAKAAKKGGTKIDSVWTREQKNTQAKNRHLLKIAEQQAEQEKWKAEQEKWKSKYKKS